MSPYENQSQVCVEYVCITFCNSLHRKIPKMPTQAVAKNSELSPIPAELSDATDLEKRLISLQIPFIK